MEGLLPQIAAPAYFPLSPLLSGKVKVCHRMEPVLMSNFERLPRKIQHSSLPRLSFSDDVPT